MFSSLHLSIVEAGPLGSMTIRPKATVMPIVKIEVFGRDLKREEGKCWVFSLSQAGIYAGFLSRF